MHGFRKSEVYEVEQVTPLRLGSQRGGADVNEGDVGTFLASFAAASLAWAIETVVWHPFTMLKSVRLRRRVDSSESTARATIVMPLL